MYKATSSIVAVWWSLYFTVSLVPEQHISTFIWCRVSMPVCRQQLTVKSIFFCFFHNDLQGLNDKYSFLMSNKTYNKNKNTAKKSASENKVLNFRKIMKIKFPLFFFLLYSLNSLNQFSNYFSTFYQLNSFNSCFSLSCFSSYPTAHLCCSVREVSSSLSCWLYCVGPGLDMMASAGFSPPISDPWLTLLFLVHTKPA